MASKGQIIQNRNALNYDYRRLIGHGTSIHIHSYHTLVTYPCLFMVLCGASVGSCRESRNALSLAWPVVNKAGQARQGNRTEAVCWCCSGGDLFGVLRSATQVSTLRSEWAEAAFSQFALGFRMQLS